MSLRDFFARIAGRPTHSGSGTGPRTRSRSDRTAILPVAARPDTVKAHARAFPHIDREASTSASRSPAEPAPGIPANPPQDLTPKSVRTSTEYPEHEGIVRDEVVGVLVAIEGELKGEVFRLFDGENKLGRAETCEVVLPSKWISREHAMLVHQGGIFAIVPLSERNRTYVGGVVVDGIEVADSDTVRLGRTTFRFRTIEGT